MLSYQQAPIAHASLLPTVGIWSEAYASPDIVDPSIQLNTTVEVDLNVTNAPAFNGYDLTLYFDPTYLQIQFVNVRAGAFSNPFIGAEDISTGQIRLAVVNIGTPFTGGNGVLAQIQFNVTGRGVSPLTLAAATTQPSRQAQSWTQLVNGYAEVPTTTENGYFSNVQGNPGPVASFTFAPDSPKAGDTITFNASESFDPDNSAAANYGIASYNWDFGDGYLATSSSPVITYTYEFGGYPYTPFNGNFSARLTVVDSDNNFEGMITERVEVTPICPPGLVSIEVPRDCPTIQAAVDSITGGGTIRVSPGTYIEKPQIQKPLTLIGSGNSTILEGLIEILAPNATVSGFRIVSNPFELGTGIELSNASRAIVRNNFIIGQRDPLNREVALFHGITVLGSASVSITDNTVEHELYGVSLQSSPNAVLQNNTLSDNNYNLDVSGSYNQDIGESNLLNGRPSFYGTAVNSSQIPSNAGYVGIVNSHDLRLEHLSTANVGQGVLIFNSTRIAIDSLETANVAVGVTIHNSTAVTVANSSIDQPALGFCAGFELDFTTQSLIANNTSGCLSGIQLNSSPQNTISKNSFEDIRAFNSPKNDYVQNQVSELFQLSESGSNRLVNNQMSGGLFIGNSPQNVFIANRISGNYYNAGIYVSSQHSGCLLNQLSCNQLADYIQEMDPSNTMNGKPIYYLVNETNVSIPSEAGFVAIVESTNVLVQHISLPFNIPVLLAIASNNVTVRENNFNDTSVFGWQDQNLTIANNNFSGICCRATIGVEDSSLGEFVGNTMNDNIDSVGVELVNSTEFNIAGNFVQGFFPYGIELLQSSNNTIFRNTILGPGIRTGLRSAIPVTTGIHLDTSSSTRQPAFGNLIVGNTIAWNHIGLQAGTNDRIYENNFVGNVIQAQGGSGDVWNNPAGQGNYWSDYAGNDTDNDGIGDTMLPHLALDNYPLMLPSFPRGLAAKLTARAAWPEFRKLSIAKQADNTQTLFALANDTGPVPEWVEAVFNVTSSNGSTFQLVSQPVWTGSGDQTSFSVHLSIVPGSYKVVATVKYSSDGYQEWLSGNSKTFSFRVVS